MNSRQVENRNLLLDQLSKELNKSEVSQYHVRLVNVRLALVSLPVRIWSGFRASRNPQSIPGYGHPSRQGLNRLNCTKANPESECISDGTDPVRPQPCTLFKPKAKFYRPKSFGFRASPFRLLRENCIRNESWSSSISSFRPAV